MPKYSTQKQAELFAVSGMLFIIVGIMLSYGSTHNSRSVIGRIIEVTGVLFAGISIGIRRKQKIK